MQHCKLLTPFQVFAAILAIQECSQSTESRLQSNYCIKFQIFAILLLCKFAHCNYSTYVWKFFTEHSQNSPIVCQALCLKTKNYFDYNILFNTLFFYVRKYLLIWLAFFYIRKYWLMLMNILCFHLKIFVMQQWQLGSSLFCLQLHQSDICVCKYFNFK